MSDLVTRANRLLAERQLNEASALFGQAIRADATCGDAWLGMGRVALELNEPAKATELLMQGLKVSPNSLPLFMELGRALTQSNNFAGACLAYEGVIKRGVKELDLTLKYADVLMKAGRLEDAEKQLRQCVLEHPQQAATHNNLGDVLKRQGKHQEAIESFRRAIACNPKLPTVRLNVAMTQMELRQFSEAVTSIQEALELDPKQVEAWFALGNAYRFLYRTGESIAAFERTLELQPDHCSALTNLGNAFKDQGRIEEAFQSYRRANVIQHDHMNSIENVLSTMHYSTECSLREIYEEHVKWDRTFAAPLRDTWRPFENDRSADRRVRVGLYSNNLGNHPVGHFVRAAFEALNREQFNVVVYSSRVTLDAERERFKSLADEWYDIVMLSPQQLSEQIRSDRIDVLIDLSGRLMGGQPLMLASKPAPILINWIGYTGTLGLSAVDYIIADRHHIPPEAEQFYVEQVLRMPDGHMCFAPPEDSPEVAPLPATSCGNVTFGSFNNPAKVNVEVVDVWAEILRQVEGSRLVLKYRNFDDVSTHAHFTRLFADRGIESHRLSLEGVSPFRDMMCRYHDIDIALDPFPFTGGMTTCLALWMGCPVLTWPRDTFASRQTLSYLHTIGFPEWVAGSRAAYVSKAVALATDLKVLADYRTRLRRTMAASPFCDRIRFTRALEQTLRDVWQKWCQPLERSGCDGALQFAEETSPQSNAKP